LTCLVTEADSVELGHRSHSAFEVGQIHWAWMTTEKMPLNIVYFRVVQLTNLKVNVKFTLRRFEFTDFFLGFCLNSEKRAPFLISSEIG